MIAFPAGPALALASAIGFGASDFVGGVAARRVAALRVVLVSYPTAMVLLGALAAIVGGPIRAGALLWGALGGLSQACGAWWLYAALGAGPISVVSPLAAMLTAGVPVVVGVALGDRPGLVPAVGIGLALVAVVLLGRDTADRDGRPHRFTLTVAWLTIGAGVGFGLNFVLIHQAPAESRLWPLLFARMAATALVIAVAALSRNLQVPSGSSLRLALIAAVLDASANVAMLLALHAALLSLASVVISLYPAATVVLAITLLGERVNRPQAVGLVLALSAVAMIASG
ncbi:DMT family transporter [Mycobacterium xenopi]|uniref:DMT family transporter n=1 Tax=Mycobacterium xenopi TaxID=1789 RepID=UPI0022EA416D|nr:DMT family transporter [Mycobacterium xenopi]MDA3664646.1 DMT family transporter [Mycobacterium xenopi]